MCGSANSWALKISSVARLRTAPEVSPIIARHANFRERYFWIIVACAAEVAFGSIVLLNPASFSARLDLSIVAPVVLFAV